MAFGSHELKKVIEDFARTAKNTKKEFSKTKKQNNKKSLIRFSNMGSILSYVSPKKDHNQKIGY